MSFSFHAYVFALFAPLENRARPKAPPPLPCGKFLIAGEKNQNTSSRKTNRKHLRL